MQILRKCEKTEENTHKLTQKFIKYVKNEKVWKKAMKMGMEYSYGLGFSMQMLEPWKKRKSQAKCRHECIKPSRANQFYRTVWKM